MTNPLVAPTKDSTTSTSGIALLDDARTLSTAIESGDWAAGVLGAAGTAMDALMVVADPFGAIFAAGVGWLMEHVGPLKEALDKLAGNPDAITAHSQTWQNVSDELGKIAQDLTSQVTSDLTDWQGAAADAYRQKASDLGTLLGAAQEATAGTSKGVKTAGEVVAAVRQLVRDTIAQVVGHMVSWALQVVLTLGIGLAWVVPQVATLVGKTATQIAKLVKNLTTAMKALTKLLSKAGGIFDDAAKGLKNVAPGSASKAGKVGDLPSGPKNVDPVRGDTTTPSSSPNLPKDTPDKVSAPPKLDDTTTPSNTASTLPKDTPDTVSAPPKLDDTTTPSNTASTLPKNTPDTASTPPKLNDTTTPSKTGNTTPPPPKLDSPPNLDKGATTPSSAGGAAADVPKTSPPPKLDDTTTPSSVADTPAPPKLDTSPPKLDTDPPKLDTTTAQGSRGIADANKAPRTNDTPIVDRTACGDPIDVSTGRVMMTQEDVELAGALPLVLSRTHLSSYRIGRSFGGSWASTVDQRVEVDVDQLHFAAEDGTLLIYPRPLIDTDTLPITGPAWPATQSIDGTYLITQRDKGRTLLFSGVSGRIIAISDLAAHHQIEFEYDEAGTLTTITHSAGYRLGVASTGGLITSLTLLSDGKPLELVRYHYNERAQLVEVVNSSEIPLSFEYDAEGRLVGWVDRNGMWYRYFYDAAGRCMRTEGKDGQLNYALRYEELRTTATDSLGNTTVYQLNSAFQVIGETDALGNVTRSEWDDRDRLLSRTDPLGRTTHYRYDEDGNLLSTRYPDGSEESTEYDEQGRPVRLTEPDGSVWLREYTGDGDLAAVVDPLGERTELSYQLPGQVSAVTDPLGNVTRYEYDSAGLPVSVTDPQGSVVRYSYDRFGRLSAETDPLGGVTRTTWTIEGAPLANVWPDGWTQFFRHDGEGNLRETTDGFGLVRTSFSAFDRPTTRIAADGSRIELSYDTESRVVAITNQQGLVWRYTYDAAGRLVEETDFNDRTRTFRYDAAGQLVEQVNAAGQTVRLGRDALGRIVRRDVDGVITTYEFDAKGRLVRARNADAELVLEYDAMDRVLKEIVNGRVLSSSYDRAGRRVQRITPTGARSDWEYDPSGRASALHTGGRTLSFRFDAAGREVERRIGASVLRQSWDSRDRLISQTVVTPGTGQAGNQLGEQRNYGYRQDGTLTSVEDLATGQRTYDLDPLGRVLAVHGKGWNERYAYDTAGNLVQPESRVYTGTLLSRDNKARYEYDSVGRLLTRWVGPNLAWRYTWDGEDRLVSVRTPGGQQWHYRYDPLGRRIAKELVGGGGAILSQTTFTWDGTQLAEEVSEDVRALVWDWEPGTERVLVQSERTLHQGSRQWQAGQVHAVVTDLAGVPTELVDAEGDLHWRGKLTLWGSAPRTMPTPLRFPGQYHDQETGLHYNFHRYYDPATARYLSPDPLGLEPATNPYAYVSNPTGWIDPLGLAPCKLSFDQVHNTPQGPSLELRGPRRTFKTGATKNKVTNPDRWNDITNKAGVPNPYKQRLSFNQDAQTLNETKPGLRQGLRDQAVEQKVANQTDSNRTAIEKLGRSDPNTKGFWEQQDRRDAHVANQSVERSRNYQPNPELAQNVDDRLRPVLDPDEGVRSLLQDHDGVVLGGAHGKDHPAWNVLQNNMQDLKNAGVNKIFLESLRDDAYGGHVRDFLNSPPGTRMHPDLERYLNANMNNREMGKVIEEAKNVGGIDVIGLNGNPARRDILGDGGMFQRHAMMNAYGAESIEHYQQLNPGKYVVEVGKAHTVPHTWNGSAPVNVGGVNLPTTSPGLGDLVNAPSVKWNDSKTGLTRVNDDGVELR